MDISRFLRWYVKGCSPPATTYYGWDGKARRLTTTTATCMAIFASVLQELFYFK